jgi:hypothetical protein
MPGYDLCKECCEQLHPPHIPTLCEHVIVLNGLTQRTVREWRDHPLLTAIDSLGILVTPTAPTIDSNNELVLYEPPATKPNEQAKNEPVVNEPAVTEAVVTEAVVNEAVVDEPVVNEPVVNEPVVNEQPATSEPAADGPNPNEPVTVSNAESSTEDDGAPDLNLDPEVLKHFPDGLNFDDSESSEDDDHEEPSPKRAKHGPVRSNIARTMKKKNKKKKPKLEKTDEELYKEIFSVDITEEERQQYSVLRHTEPKPHAKSTFYARMKDDPCLDVEIPGEEEAGASSSRRISDTMIRIRKIRALAERAGTAAEAAQAWRLYQKAVAQHGIVESELKETDGRAHAREVFFYKVVKKGQNKGKSEIPLEKFPTKSDPWVQALMNYVSDQFGVRAIRCRWDRKGNDHCNIMFVGRAANVDEAALTFEVAVNKMEAIVQRIMSKSKFQALKHDKVYTNILYSCRVYVAQTWCDDQMKESKPRAWYELDERERLIFKFVLLTLGIQTKPFNVRRFKLDSSVRGDAMAAARGSSLNDKFLKS